MALAAAEAGWRVLRTRHYGPATNPDVVLHDAALGWRYRPGAQVRHRTPAFDVDIRIDERGRRTGRSPTAPHPSLVFIGDSMTFGWGVEGHETFPSLVQAALGGTAWNLGVAGFGTDQELLVWRRDGASLHPDAVVVTYTANDVEDVLRASRYGRAKPRFEAHGDDLRLAPPGASVLERSSSFYRSLRYFLAQRFTPPMTAAETAQGRALVARLLDAMAHETHAMGVPLVVVSADAPWLHDGLRERPGVIAIDVGPALAAAAVRDGPVLFASDPHWNAHGHRIVAAAVAAALTPVVTSPPR